MKGKDKGKKKKKDKDSDAEEDSGVPDKQVQGAPETVENLKERDTGDEGTE